MSEPLLAGHLNGKLRVTIDERREDTLGFTLDLDPFEALQEFFPQNPELELS